MSRDSSRWDEEARSVLLDIARVASLDYQMHDCVGATADRYVLLDELLDTTVTSAHREASHPTGAGVWRPNERLALLGFAESASRFFGQVDWENAQLSVADIVDSDTMELIRAAARQCLESIGVVFVMQELLDG